MGRGNSNYKISTPTIMVSYDDGFWIKDLLKYKTKLVMEAEVDDAVPKSMPPLRELKYYTSGKAQEEWRRSGATVTAFSMATLLAVTLY